MTRGAEREPDDPHSRCRRHDRWWRLRHFFAGWLDGRHVSVLSFQRSHNISRLLPAMGRFSALERSFPRQPNSEAAQGVRCSPPTMPSTPLLFAGLVLHECRVRKSRLLHSARLATLSLRGPKHLKEPSDMAEDNKAAPVPSDDEEKRLHKRKLNSVRKQCWKLELGENPLRRTTEYEVTDARMTEASHRQKLRALR